MEMVIQMELRSWEYWKRVGWRIKGMENRSRTPLVAAQDPCAVLVASV